MTRHRLLPVVLLLLLPAQLLAETADLELFIDAPPAVKGGDALTWAVTVRNLGPDAATGVSARTGIEYELQICSDSIATLAAGAMHTLTCTATPAGPPYIQRITAFVESATSDPNSGNDHGGKTFDIITGPDLDIDVWGADAIDPALPFDVTVVWRNAAWTTAHEAIVSVDIDGAAAVTSIPETCSATGTRIVCNAGDVPSQLGTTTAAPALKFTAIAPEQGTVDRITATATITAREADADPSSNRDAAHFEFIPTIYVTSTGDSGSGSLREAIDRANAECNASVCKIAFRIPNETAPWVTIAPLTPLPTVSARHVLIDGSTQTAFFGDSNPQGPEIEILGSGLSDGDGLRLTTPCRFDVRGLAINGFPGNGVWIGAPGPCPPEEPHGRGVVACAIGTDPTGRNARPNFRGVFFDDADPVWGAGVAESIISGNTRSGVYIARGKAWVSANIIGLTQDLLEPLPNGASGIYVGPDGDGTSIANNYIGFNRHFGVAIDREADFVSLPGNSFQANGGLAIDRGLDGADAILGIIDRLPEPEITSAGYDAFDGITIIEGTYARSGIWPYYTLALYANDAADESGFGEGQYTLVDGVRIDDGVFRVSVRGDLRGKWISATATMHDPPDFAKPVEGGGDFGGYETTTSEFSRAVKVE